MVDTQARVYGINAYQTFTARFSSLVQDLLHNQMLVCSPLAAAASCPGVIGSWASGLGASSKGVCQHAQASYMSGTYAHACSGRWGKHFHTRTQCLPGSECIHRHCWLAHWERTEHVPGIDNCPPCILHWLCAGLQPMQQLPEALGSQYTWHSTGWTKVNSSLMQSTLPECQAMLLAQPAIRCMIPPSPGRTAY